MFHGSPEFKRGIVTARIRRMSLLVAAQYAPREHRFFVALGWFFVFTVFKRKRFRKYVASKNMLYGVKIIGADVSTGKVMYFSIAFSFNLGGSITSIQVKRNNKCYRLGVTFPIQQYFGK